MGAENRRMRAIVVSALAAVMLVAATAADAGGGHRHGRHGHARIGIHIGAPVVFSSWWLGYPHYYHSPPPVVVRERIVVREPLVYYDERGNPVPPARPQAQANPAPRAESAAPTWFFCRDSQAYYPYVQDCASPWQRVVPHPPPAAN